MRLFFVDGDPVIIYMLLYILYRNESGDMKI